MTGVAESTTMHLQGFHDLTSLITGGGRGIGRRIAETFVALGARVATLDLVSPDIDGSLDLECATTDGLQTEESEPNVLAAVGASGPGTATATRRPPSVTEPDSWPWR